ncbi:outer membrane beta-barrel protein [Flavobacteriaceae bacterium TP-CH-4]|uniref:Outer membrane beta-barrel protein n=1 Tax=Pelagihabitans pacificus TaxID=2696054 RepID=A0A967AUA8_9FLAO|nr:outer membrane beta-barrel protein [Pelagihabitans pacificus]NHF59143.1 outer membrane beta-barrel protein [Pelagihabitans pacificus]
MGKKKLDELFQEKFQDFNQLPDEKVWQRLEAALDKKDKSRRVPPFWWKFAGIAAGLLIAFWLINPFFDGSENQNSTVTDVEQNKKETVNPVDDAEAPFRNSTDAKKDAFVDTDKEAVQNNKMNEEGVPKEAILTATEKKPTPKNNMSEASTNNKGGETPGIKERKSQLTSAPKDEEKTSKSRINFDSITKKTNIGVAVTADPENSGKAEKKRFETTSREAVVQNEQKPPETVVTDSENEKNRGLENSQVKKSGEAIAQIDEKGDEQSVPEKKKKSIFDEIGDQEEAAVVERSESRWSAGASIAPVYYSAFGEGSPVHSIFVPNSKSGETNLSYGLSVAYEINDRLSVRSGIHRVDYGYGTDDVEFTSSLEGFNNGQIDNINYSLNSRSLVVQSKAGETVQSVNDMPAQVLDVNASLPSRDGTMSQQFGYLEVPLELNYALVDRKFGVNLIGGVSSLFLIDNSVTLNSGNQTLEMGEANNVNNLNFSTNIGFGFDYNFTPKVKLNIEPVFKYQLNTFSNVDGTFQPFTVGVYSGLSFRF